MFVPTLFRLNANVFKHAGFTVIETIFSVAISGILAASVVTAVAGHTQAVQAENASTSRNISFSRDITNPSITSLTGLDQGISDSAAFQKQIEITAAQTELKIVQTAVDIMMINSGTKVILSTLKTNDMASFPAGSPLYPEYIREQFSKYTYKCNSRGEVIQQELAVSSQTE